MGRLEPLWGLNTARAKISRQVKTRLLFVFQSQSFDSNGRLFFYFIRKDIPPCFTQNLFLFES